MIPLMFTWYHHFDKWFLVFALTHRTLPPFGTFYNLTYQAEYIFAMEKQWQQLDFRTKYALNYNNGILANSNYIPFALARDICIVYLEFDYCSSSGKRCKEIHFIKGDFMWFLLIEEIFSCTRFQCGTSQVDKHVI